MSDTDTVTREAHEALVDKARHDAAADSIKQMEIAQARVHELETANAELDGLNATLRSEVTKLNDELDQAQIAFKAAKDQIRALKDDIKARDVAAQAATIAAARADQVKKLGLFDDEYVAEKASQWAAIPDDDWSQRLEEWSKLRPATQPTDEASAMSGTSGSLTSGGTESGNSMTAARAALGLA